MDRRRTIVGLLYLAVAGLMAITVDPTDPIAADSLARLFVVIVALLLAVLYLFDPLGILERHPLH
ncbi:hypothetical protein [Natrarchaeobaculum sulfurireducens]|nr:hypothetical protein [Natrarchaeobaculum sulfurireducens]